MRWFFTICVLLNALHSSPDAHADEIAELRARADQGNASAQYNLGDMYCTTDPQFPAPNVAVYGKRRHGWVHQPAGIPSYAGWRENGEVE